MIKLVISIGAALFLLNVGYAEGYSNFYDYRYNSPDRAHRYDWHMCVSSYRDPCVSNICIVSEDRDCQPTCLKLARAKCVEDGLNPPVIREFEYNE